MHEICAEGEILLVLVTRCQYLTGTRTYRHTLCISCGYSMDKSDVDSCRGLRLSCEPFVECMCNISHPIPLTYIPYVSIHKEQNNGKDALEQVKFYHRARRCRCFQPTEYPPQSASAIPSHLPSHLVLVNAAGGAPSPLTNNARVL